ncbi:chromate transporter [Bacillaceae bacterium S4-13-58]
MQKIKLLGEIFITRFFKIGPVTFGGGYAIIPMIERGVVSRKNGQGRRDCRYFAEVESIPGAFAIIQQPLSVTV